MPYQTIEKPVRRSAFRSRLGRLYYGLLRHFLWVRMRRMFASDRSEEPLVVKNSAIMMYAPFLTELEV